MWLTWLLLYTALIPFSTNDDALDELLNIMDQGDQEIDFLGQTDFIVLLGLSGSGKSTLAHYMSGDPTTLIGEMKRGDLIYVDTEGQISTGDTVSKTLFPEATLDGDQAVIDTPGFQDTRNETFEIATSYFIKKVFDNSTRVKMVMVAPQSAFKSGDRHQFDFLLQSMIQLVLDVDKYASALCLVASKVVNRSFNDSDEVGFIKEYIVDAREEYKQKLQDTTDPEEIIDLTKIIKIIDIILDEQKERVSVFRAPYQEGPISDSKQSLDNKANIRQEVFEVAQYVESGPDDFGFPLTVEAQDFITGTVFGAISDKITSMLNTISSALIQKINYLGENSESVLQLKNDTTQLYDILWSVDGTTDISRKDFEDYVIACINYLSDSVRFTVTSKSFTDLLGQFDFFSMFTDNVSEPIADWMNSFDGAKDLSEYLQNWYITLVSMYSMAGTYEVQNTKYTKFDKSFLDMEYSVSQSDLTEFLLKIKSSELTSYPDQLNDLIFNNQINFRQFILRDIGIVLNLTRPNVTCTEETLFVRSNFVSIQSDVMSHITSDCMNVTSINIMSFERVFFDIDLNIRDSDVSIIGKDLEIFDSSNIDVTGSSGSNWDPPKAQQSDAKGQYTGIMGLPGQPGGHVIIISSSILNGFDIVTNGGNGGSGQEGGNGTEVLEDNYFPGEEIFFLGPVYMKDTYCKNSHLDCELLESNQYFHRWSATDIQQYVEQLPGNGGKSGYSGYPGTVSVIVMNESQLNLETNIGTAGQPGAGGRGWKLSYSMMRCSDYFEFPHNIYQCNRYIYEEKHYIFGSSGVGTAGEEQPINRTMPFQTIYDIIDYKFYIMTTNLLYSKDEFLESLITNTDILSYYNIHALIQEFSLLEIRKNDITDGITEEYLNLMIPIVQNWNTTNYDDKQVMTFLLSSLSTMMWSLQTANETVFVINLYDYVDSTLVSVNELEQLGMIQATENIKNTYSKSIDQNMLEAQNYITQIVNIDFEEIFANIQMSVNNLVLEVQELEAEIEIQLDKLRAKQKQLQHSMIGHCIFGVINVAASALSIMGPVGSAAGLAIGAGSGIAEHIIVGNVTVDPNNPISLPNGVHNLLEDIMKLRQSRQQGHMEVILFTCDSYLSFPLITDEEKQQVEEIKKNALTLQDIKDIQECNRIVQSSINGLQDISKNLKPGENIQLTKLLNNTQDIMVYAKTTTQIAGPLLDAMKNYNNDQTKLEIVVNMIKEDEQSLNELSDYQDAIYEIIVPMLDSFHEDMSNLEDELTNQSSVSLVVKQWEISSNIRKMRNLMARWTEGFKVENDFIRYFDELDEAANLVVTLFEQIQYYQEQKDFSAYIASLNQVGGGNIPENAVYKAELSALKASMLTNTVKSQCNTIITSFKQQVFPFAYKHLGSLSQLHGHYCDGDQYTITNTIKTVKTELGKMRDTIMNGEDEFIHLSVFDSTNLSTPPFAMWYNHTDGEFINKLMKGEAVAFFAPVIGKKNAVKFNNIKIRFTRTDGGSQEDLDQVLKGFSMEQTHFGNSLYQCDGIEYIVRSQPVLLSYSLEMDDKGEPLDSNLVYKKIQTGDVTLSPNTMWRFQLKIRYAKEASFGMLSNFTKSNINLELYGKGQYVEKDVAVCKTRLEEYYDINYPTGRHPKFGLYEN